MACSLGQAISQIEPLGPLLLSHPLGIWCGVSGNGLQVDINQEMHRPLLFFQHPSWEAGLRVSSLVGKKWQDLFLFDL